MSILTPDQILQFLTDSVVRGKAPILAEVVIVNGTQDASAETGEPYAVWVRGIDTEEIFVAYRNPGLDLTALAENVVVRLELRGGQFWITGIDGIMTAQRLAGGELPTNFANRQHNHEDQANAGQLNASAIFSAGAVPLAHGGTNANTTGLTTGALIAKTATTLSAANLALHHLLTGNGTGAPLLIAPGAVGQYLRSNGTSFASSGLNVADATSGLLALARGGTGNDLSTTGPGRLRQLTTGANISVILDNYTASSNPTVTDDSSAGYTFASLWINTSAARVFICVDPTIGAAAWVEVTAAATGANTSLSNLSAVAINTSLLPDADDLHDIGSTSLAWRNAFLQILTLKERASVATPPTGEIRVYASTDKFLYSKDSLGTERLITSPWYINADTIYAYDITSARLVVGDNFTTARVAFVGSADETQLRITNYSTQTEAPLVITDHDFLDLLHATAAGGLALNLQNSSSAAAGLTVGAASSGTRVRITPTQGIGINTTPTRALDVAATGTTAAMRLSAQTAPGTPANGDLWFDSARSNTLQSFGAGMRQNMAGRVYGHTSNTGPVNTTSTTNLFPSASAIGTNTLPANFWSAGTSIRVAASGFMSTGGTARDITLNFVIGSVTITSQTVSVTAATAGRSWYVEFDVTCRSTGTSGTLFTQGRGAIWTETLNRLETSTTTTHNTTTSMSVQISIAFGTTSTTSQLICTNASIIVYP